MTEKKSLSHSARKKVIRDTPVRTEIMTVIITAISITTKSTVIGYLWHMTLITTLSASANPQ